MHRVAVGFVVLNLLWFHSLGFAEDWKPPANPDPQTILNEARADAADKKYETALTKHLWFHENALSINPAMSGVRLSFALSAWEKLGREYPPALEEMKFIRDSLEGRVRNGEDIGRGFHDLAAINQTLKQDERTAESFRQVDSQNPEAAKKAFHYVKAALIKDRAYELYVKYVDAKRDFLRIRYAYDMNKNMAEKSKFGASLAEFGDKSFRNGCSTLVAILVVCDREKEAEEIAELAKKELDDAGFHAELESALSGTVPTPWP